MGFPDSSVGKESACNAGEPGSIPDLGGSPWRRERLLTPVLWPGEFHVLHSLKKLDMTEQLSLSLKYIETLSGPNCYPFCCSCKVKFMKISLEWRITET